MSTPPTLQRRLLVGGLRRVESWSGDAKRRLLSEDVAAVPVAAETAAAPVAEGSPTTEPEPEEAHGYGRYWMPSADTEAMLQIYNTDDPASFEEGGQIDAKILQPYFDASSTVLDLGCGTGRVARYVAPGCATLWAVDASTRMLELAGKRLHDLANVRYAQCHDVTIPDVASASVDLAYSLLVLQHLEREDAFLLLRELRRIIKPSGTVVLTFPNLLSDIYLQSFVTDATKADRNPVRARIYTPQEVQRLLPAVGFSAEIDAGTEIRAVCHPMS